MHLLDSLARRDERWYDYISILLIERSLGNVIRSFRLSENLKMKAQTTKLPLAISRIWNSPERGSSAAYTLAI